jgi:hypothetical protein
MVQTGIERHLVDVISSTTIGYVEKELSKMNWLNLIYSEKFYLNFRALKKK